MTLTLGSGPVSFGGGGWLTPRDVPTDGGSPGSDLLLRVGYAGLMLQRAVAFHGRSALDARALLGAGNAKLSLPGVGSRIASDNFLVVEPEILLSFTVASRIRARTGVGYRYVAGVEDLPGVGRDRLSGVTFGVYLAAGPF